MKLLILILFIFNLSCASVQIELKPKINQQTSFIHYTHYGLWGLIGSDHLDIIKACINSTPTKIKNYFSGEDILFSILTLGLYTPKSTKIWCEFPVKELKL